MRLRREVPEEEDTVIDLRERLEPYTKVTDEAALETPARPRRREPLRAAPHEPRHLVS